jgi:hypothetical protein
LKISSFARLLRLFRGFRSCRAARDRRRSFCWPDARARLASIACDHLTRASTGGVGLHPASTRLITHSRASPFRTLHPVHRPVGDITTTFACASASCAARPPGLIESIDPRQALRARPVVMVTTGPTTAGLTCGTLACVPPSTCLAPECWSGASLEVFVPCNAHWLRSRCPGRPASGRSRFGVSISVNPRISLNATC